MFWAEGIIAFYSLCFEEELMMWYVGATYMPFYKVFSSRGNRSLLFPLF